MEITGWASALTAFEIWERAADRADGTIWLRRHQLGRLSEAFPQGPSSPSTDDLAAWLGSQGWATETMRGHRASVRVFYRWAAAHGVVDHDPAMDLPSIRPAMHIPRPVEDTAWRRTLMMCDPRTALIIELGARLGLRRAEIAAVHSHDVTQDLVGWTLRVRGKGRKVRLVPMPGDLARRILAADGWVFPSPAGGHLTPAHIGVLVRRASEGEWSTHQLRHRFGTAVYAATGDLLATQQLMGHAKPETTAGYVALANSRLRDAAAAAA